MTFNKQAITDEIKALRPSNFEQLMAGVLTMMLVAFVLSGIAMGKEIPEWLIGVTGTVIGVWFQRKSQ